MNLLNIILNEKVIGGLEIADNGFRFSRLKKDKSGLKVELLFEELFTEKEALAGEPTVTNKLLKFIKQHNLEYVIISLPASSVFVKTYDFNLNMSDNKIAEAMALNIDLQLPKKKTEIYCDWMKIDSEGNKKILLAYVLKDYINNLITKIKNTGIKIVAIESHQLSLARCLKQAPNETSLIIERGAIHTSFYLIKNNNLFFSQSVPNERIGTSLNKEVDKIINYQDYQDITIKNIILIGPFSEAEIKKLPIKAAKIELIDEFKQIQNTKWAIVLGAALRGLISRKDDKMISLMEIDTEKAYFQEKVRATVSFLISISIALCVFFVGIFLLSWYLITAQQNNYNKQILSFNLSESPTGSTALKDEASFFNNLIGQTASLVKKEVAWSKIISEIKDKTTPDIIINNVSLPSADGELSVTGIAANREAINNLKKSFETSNILEAINIPLSNLGKKVDIPFSMTFKLKV